MNIASTSMAVFPMWLGASLALCDDPPLPWRVWAKETVWLEGLEALLAKSPLVLGDFSLSWEQVTAIAKPAQSIVLEPVGESLQTWHLQLDQFFSAQYDRAAQHVQMQFIRDDLPQITLSNVLRFVTSIRLPLENKGLMLHASSGGTNVGAVFAGISTAGKSTLAFAFEQVDYFSDDISLLTFADDKVWLTGSPFFGLEGHRGAQKRLPLAAFCLLEEKSFDGKTRVEKIPKAQGIAMAMRHAVNFSQNATLAGAILDQLLYIAERVPFVRIHRSLETSSDAVFAQVLDVVSAGAL